MSEYRDRPGLPSREQEMLHYQWLADMGYVDAQRVVGHLMSQAGEQSAAKGVRYIRCVLSRSCFQWSCPSNEILSSRGCTRLQNLQKVQVTAPQFSSELKCTASMLGQAIAISPTEECTVFAPVLQFPSCTFFSKSPCHLSQMHQGRFAPIE